MRNGIIQIVVVTMLASCVADAPSMAPSTLEDPIASAASSTSQGAIVAGELPQAARNAALAKVRAEHPWASTREHTVSVDSHTMLSDNSGGEAKVRFQYELPGGKRFDGHIYEVDLVRASNGTWSAPTLRAIEQYSGVIETPPSSG